MKNKKMDFGSLTAELPVLPKCPRGTLGIVSEYLRKKGFVYRENVASIEDVVSLKSGSCLGLSLLVSELLSGQGRTPECRILIHPRDAVDRADRKLFQELMSGEYFDYESPVLPKLSDQPSLKNRIHRFLPLGHPLVVLDGIPLETTLMVDPEADSLIEYPAESSNSYGSEVLGSYLLSDQAKFVFSKNRTAPAREALCGFRDTIQKSLAIFPGNRDAWLLQWQYGNMSNQDGIRDEAMGKLKDLGPLDSDLSYKLWSITGDVQYLNTTLEQFPEHILAFLDRKVFLEKDRGEARMNLAVALWCITYSGILDLKDFLRDVRIKKKIAELFSEGN